MDNRLQKIFGFTRREQLVLVVMLVLLGLGIGLRLYRHLVPGVKEVDEQEFFIGIDQVPVTLPTAPAEAPEVRDKPRMQRTGKKIKKTDRVRVTGPVNINTASETELAALPRIGPALAQRIIQYRQEHGPFKQPDHIQQVKGIGEKTFRTLRPLITVE